MTSASTPAADPPPQPVPDADSRGHWEATAAGRLTIRRCQECGWWAHPPLERCRRCAGPTADEEVTGEGTLHSFTVIHRAAVPGFADRVPYVVGLVDLDEQEGLRLAARVDGVNADQLRIGQRVRARIEPHPGGDFHVPVFTPAPQADTRRSGSRTSAAKRRSASSRSSIGGGW